MSPLLRRPSCWNHARLPSHLCFSEVFRAKRTVELHLQEAANAAGSGISRWWFGCLGPCAPPSRGALALPATTQGVKMPFLLTLWLRFLLGGEKKRMNSAPSVKMVTWWLVTLTGVSSDWQLLGFCPFPDFDLSFGSCRLILCAGG